MSNSKKKCSRLQNDSLNSNKNSFLEEVPRNYDIDNCLRNEIEKRYKRSKVNASYRFPRKKSTEDNLRLGPKIRNLNVNSPPRLKVAYSKPVLKCRSPITRKVRSPRTKITQNKSSSPRFGVKHN